MSLENQYENLKEQSEKAKSFIELSNKLKEIEINLLIRKIEELKEEINKSRKKKKTSRSNRSNDSKRKIKLKINLI